MRVRGAFDSIKIRRKTKEQHVAQIIEDRLVHSRVAALRRPDRTLDDLTIFVADRLTRRKISSVNREAGDVSRTARESASRVKSRYHRVCSESRSSMFPKTSTSLARASF